MNHEIRNKAFSNYLKRLLFYHYYGLTVKVYINAIKNTVAQKISNQEIKERIIYEYSKRLVNSNGK